LYAGSVLLKFFFNFLQWLALYFLLQNNSSAFEKLPQSVAWLEQYYYLLYLNYKEQKCSSDGYH